MTVVFKHHEQEEIYRLHELSRRIHPKNIVQRYSNTAGSRKEDDIEINRESPENCVESINLLSKAIVNSHRDILYYSALQGDLLSDLRLVSMPEGFRLHFKKDAGYILFSREISDCFS